MAIQPEGATPLSPYRGLEPFDERDAPFFFGRERETRLIAASLFASPLTLLYGASGVGKSSVLRAGVLPRLRDRRDLIPVVFPTYLTDGRSTSTSVALGGWQSDPLGGIKEAVAVALYNSAGDDLALYARYQDVALTNEMAPLRQFLLACHNVTERRLMLILDQFEEYSLYHPEDDEFGKQFPMAIVAGDLSVSFLISLREDSLAKLDRFKGRIPTLWDSYRRIDYLDRAAAEDAIRRPLIEYHKRQPEMPEFTIEDGLVAAVLSQVPTDAVPFEATGSGTVESDPGVEARIETPYLQLVMMRLWEREQTEGSSALRLSTLQAEGGAAEIVRTHLDRVMEQFTAEERDVAARVFHRLVTPSGAKIAFSVSDLAAYDAIDPQVLAPILTRLEEGSRRILRRVASRADVAGEPRYEIFHDRLGKAILSWRAKRLQEQERERRQREEAEQKRIAEKTKASLRVKIDAAMDRLGAEGQVLWSRLMFYLVSTDGKRLTQTVSDLAKLSFEPRGDVEVLVNRLMESGVLRSAYRSTSSPEPFYEVVDDTLTGALLEWHSKFVVDRTRATSGEAVAPREVARPAPIVPGSRSAETFPYRLMREQFLGGRGRGGVVPFLGAGVSLSASPPVASGRELKEQLAGMCEFPASEFERSTVAEVASFFVQRAGRQLLDNVLHEALGSGVHQPSQTHRLLAELAKVAPLLILTTNYDTLMEQALDELEVPYEAVSYIGDAEDPKHRVAVVKQGASVADYADPKTYLNKEDQTVVYRLNGPAIVQGKPVGCYSVTEEDNIDWIVNLAAALPGSVRWSLQRSTLLSLGHSASDWSQRALLRTMYRSNRGGSWAVALNPTPLSVMTWQRYDVNVYNLDLNEWAARMRAAGPA